VRRYTALAAAVAALAVAAPPALASSIVYEKGGDVWAANPDGSGQRPVTTSGGYTHPSQASDGTIAAVKGGLLQRLDRGGNVLNLAGDPEGSGPILSSISPNGSLIAYHFNATGSIVSGLRTALSHADRQTSNDEIFNIGGWINPTWIGDNTILMFDGSETFTGDTLLKTLGASGTQPWYEDPGLSLSGGDVDPTQTRFAATDGSTIRLYRLNAPPPAIAVEPRCNLTGPNGSFFRPTWSPDGSQLAWQEDDGIWVADVNLDDCAQTGANMVIPGGHSPDWGPAAAGRALSASAPKRVKLSALLKGLKLRVNCQCTVTATMLLGGKAIGQAKKLVLKATTLTVKPTRAGKKRLRRGGKSVKMSIGGGGKFVTRKVRIAR
jgi:hypothetical protein